MKKKCIVKERHRHAKDTLQDTAALESQDRPPPGRGQDNLSNFVPPRCEKASPQIMTRVQLLVIVTPVNLRISRIIF